MTEIEAKNKLDRFMLVINEVWERFEDKFFNGQGIEPTLAEMETLIHRFRGEIEKRNGNGTDI